MVDTVLDKPDLGLLFGKVSLILTGDNNFEIVGANITLGAKIFALIREKFSQGDLIVNFGDLV